MCAEATDAVKGNGVRNDELLRLRELTELSTDNERWHCILLTCFIYDLPVYCILTCLIIDLPVCYTTIYKFIPMYLQSKQKVLGPNFNLKKNNKNRFLCQSICYLCW